MIKLNKNMAKFKKDYSEWSATKCFEFFERRCRKGKIVKTLKSILLEKLTTKDCDIVLTELFRFEKWIGTYYETLPSIALKQVYLPMIYKLWGEKFELKFNSIDSCLRSHVNCLIDAYFSAERKHLNAEGKKLINKNKGV